VTDERQAFGHYLNIESASNVSEVLIWLMRACEGALCAVPGCCVTNVAFPFMSQPSSITNKQKQQTQSTIMTLTTKVTSWPFSAPQFQKSMLLQRQKNLNT
jgi:hypothetical protein